jgi:hypothetical protein
MDGRSLALVAKPMLPPSEFEKKWLSQGVWFAAFPFQGFSPLLFRLTHFCSCVVKEILSKAPSVAEFTAMMTQQNISVLASAPPQNGVVKFFLFAQEV